MDARSLVAWNLRRIRVAQGLSQEKLAVDAGVDRTYVSSLERKVENPTIAVIERLASAMSVHISEFFLEPPKGSRKPAPLPGGRKPRVVRRMRAD